MSTSFPQRCPFCDSHDVRRFAPPDSELASFRCRECTKVFYVPADPAGGGYEPVKTGRRVPSEDNPS